jgi:hypothetical protein
MDSQSVKPPEMGGPERGYDGGKQIKRRKRHLATEKHLDLSVFHGDGTNTVAKKGAMALATQATSMRKGRRSSP